VIAGFILLTVLTVVVRGVIYKVHPNERALHMRGGYYLTVDEPGWHVQIPLWDTVILVKVNERLGYIDQIRAVTSDDLTMDVSLEYTYRVTDPTRFALDVDNPERILFEFVQGKLRDVINTMQMGDVMHGRTEVNDRLLGELQAKEAQYGVEFVTVQIQSASPPGNVVTAIEERMVATQIQEQAEAQAAQKRVMADAEHYAARSRLMRRPTGSPPSPQHRSKQPKPAVGPGRAPRSGSSLSGVHDSVALQSNSKWVIGTDGTPILDLRDTTGESPVPSLTPAVPVTP